MDVTTDPPTVDAAEPLLDIPGEPLLDITGEVCPMTMVRTRLALDALAPGARLAVMLRGDEPRRSVPATVRSLGHRVLDVANRPDGITLLRIEKAAT